MPYWNPALAESIPEGGELPKLDTAERVSTKIEKIGQRMRNVEEVFSALKENLDQILGNQWLDAAKYPQITFRSTSVEPRGDGLHVRGDLTLLGQTRPLAFDVSADGDGDGALSAVAVVKQTDWGMKPYSTLYGALKVVDEVEVSLASPPQSE